MIGIPKLIPYSSKFLRPHSATTLILLLLLLHALAYSANAQGLCASVGSCTRTSTLDEYRHKPSGVHFYTACSEEKATLNNLPELFELSGRKIPFSDAVGANSTSITRFYFSGGSLAANRHFYTSIGGEVNNLSITGFPWGFQLCSEGERGRAYEPTGLATQPFASDPRLLDISAANAYCLQGQMPVWRVLQQNPVQHRLSALFPDYEMDRSAAGAVDEGVRLCVHAPWQNARTSIVAPSAALLTDLDREATIQITAPNTATGVRVSVSLPAHVEVTGFTGVLSGGVCTISSTVANGRNLTCALPAGSSLTRSGNILLRATSSFNPGSPGQIKALAVADSTPTTAFAADHARGCTAMDRPMYGCSVADLPNAPASSGLPSFTIGAISVTGLTTTETGGRGTLLVPITTTSAADAGKLIRIFGETSSVGSGLFLSGGSADYTLPSSGQTVTFNLEVNSDYNPADLRVCVSTPEFTSGTRGYQVGCTDPSKNRKSNTIYNQSFGTSPPPTTLQVGVYNMPTGTVGSNYTGSFYCIGPSGLGCEVIGLPSGLFSSCGPRLGTMIDCVINGTPTIAGVSNVSLRATAPGQTPVSRSEVIEIRGSSPPPATLNINLGNPIVDGVLAGSPNRFRVSVQAQSDPAGSVNLTVYLKESSTSGWNVVGGENGVGLSIAPQTFTFDINTTSTNFSVRVCARTPFGSSAECAADSPEQKPSGNPAYTTAGPITIGPPPAQLQMAWVSQPGSASVGAVANYSLSVRSQYAANPVVGPLWLHIGIPTNWTLDAATSVGCTQSGQKASCQVIATGPLSATSPVVMNFGLKPNVSSGGINVFSSVTVTSSITPPATVSCSPVTSSCINSNPLSPNFYDLIPQTSNAAPPASAASTVVKCIRNGTVTPPSDAACRIEITYTDASIASSGNVPYTGIEADITLCGPDVPTTTVCSHRLAAGKTVQIMRLTALDGSITQDNDPSNNSRVVFDATPPPPPIINTSGMPSSATQDQSYSGSFYCEGSIMLTAFACSVAGLPAGLTQGACLPTTTATQRRLTCSVAGSPSTAGTFSLTYTASASNASTVTATSSLNVAPPVVGCTPDSSARLIEEVIPDNQPLRIRTLSNGVHFIRIAPSPSWRLGKTIPDSVNFYFEGLLSSVSNRVIALSMCPGDTTADEQTFNILSGDDAMGGQIYFYQLPTGSAPEPSNFPSKRTNGLPGVGASTPWYINIRQTTCTDPSGACRFNYNVFP